MSYRETDFGKTLGRLISVARQDKRLLIVQMYGAIASGKSTVTDEIAKSFEEIGKDIIVIREQHLECDGTVSDYYNDSDEAAKMLALEHKICGDRLDLFVKTLEDAPDCAIIVSDRSLIEDITFIKHYVEEIDAKCLCGESALGLGLLESRIKYADDIIHKLFKCIDIRIDTPYHECVERVAVRGRAFETGLTATKIAELDEISLECLRPTAIRLNGELHPALNGAISVLEMYQATHNDACISIYGIPGAGKTTLMHAMKEILAPISPATIEDDSNSDGRIRVMTSMYHSQTFDGEKLQTFLDIDRAAQIDTFLDAHVEEQPVVITDIGKYTSEVFSRANGHKVPQITRGGESYKDFFVWACECCVRLDYNSDEGLRERDRRGEECVSLDYLNEVDSRLISVLPTHKAVYYTHSRNVCEYAESLIEYCSKWFWINENTNLRKQH